MYTSFWNVIFSGSLGELEFFHQDSIDVLEIDVDRKARKFVDDHPETFQRIGGPIDVNIFRIDRDGFYGPKSKRSEFLEF